MKKRIYLLLSSLFVFSLVQAGEITYDFDDNNASVDSNTFPAGVVAGDIQLNAPGGQTQIAQQAEVGARTPQSTISLTIHVDAVTTLNLTQISFKNAFRNTFSTNTLTPEWALSITRSSGGAVSGDNLNGALPTSTSTDYFQSSNETVNLTGLNGVTNESITFTWSYTSPEDRSHGSLNRVHILDDLVFTGTAASQPLPVISSFVSDVNYAKPGQSVTLSWLTSDADTLSIDQGVGGVSDLTSVSVVAAPPTTYTLTATNVYGSVSKEVTVFNQAAPNIVFFLADDMGWTDLNGFNQYSSKWYQTPHLETLAAQSVKFDNCYAEPVCSPTRADLMTGMYPTRHHMYTVTNPNDNGKQLGRRENNSHHLPMEFTTIADVLKTLGYRCAHLGKWHMGRVADSDGPLSRGFDYNVGGGTEGMPGGGSSNADGPDTSSATYTGGKYWAGYDGSFQYLDSLPANGVPGQYLTDRLTDDSIDIMEAEKHKPFFINLWHYGIHAPVQSPLADRITDDVPDPLHPGHSNEAFAGMIHALDRSVGSVINYLETTDDPRNPGYKLIDNTMFIFMTDNGGYTSRSDNNPLRSGKSSFYEGGVRVPLMIRWAGKTGTRKSLVHAVDFFSSLVEFAGGDSQSYSTDGLSLLPLLDNEAYRYRAVYRHQPVHMSSMDCSSSITLGNYKLLYAYNSPGSSYQGYGYYELYDLGSDLSESNNLLDVPGVDFSDLSTMKTALTNAEHLEVFFELAEHLNRWLIDTNAALPYTRATLGDNNSAMTTTPVTLPDIASIRVASPVLPTPSVPQTWKDYHYAGAYPGDDSDSDHDGQTSKEEFIAGTNPNDSTSRFVAHIVTDEDDGIRIGWDAIPDRYYTVSYSPSLNGDFIELEDQIEFPVNSFLDTSSVGESRRFYKVTVEKK